MERDKDGRFSGTIRVGEFASARARALELAIARQGNGKANDDLKRTSSSGTVCGQPRHLRRRTRSHKSFEVPRKLREGGRYVDQKLIQLKDDVNRADSSRNTREKRRMSKKELANSKRGVWLETHQWNAKRMRMDVGPDGRMAPLYPLDKGHRFVLDQAINGCTVNDFSFLCFLRVSVSSHDFPLFEKCMIRVGAGKVLDSAHLEGSRVGFVPNLHWPTEEHNGRDIGPITFAWNGCGKDISGAKSTWLLYIWLDPRMLSEAKSCLEAVFSGNFLFKDISDFLSVFRLRGERSSGVIMKAFGDCVPISAHSMVVYSPNCLPFGVGFLTHCQMEGSMNDASVPDEKLYSSTLVDSWVEGFKTNIGFSLEELYKFSEKNKKAMSGPALLLRSVNQGWDVMVPSNVENFTSQILIQLVHAGATPAGLCNEDLAVLASGDRVYPSDFPGTKAFDAHWAQREQLESKIINSLPLSKRPRFSWPLTPSFHLLRDGPPQLVSNDLLFVRLFLCYRQPKGARTRLEDTAQILMASDEDRDSYLNNNLKGVSMQIVRPGVGFVTSSIGRNRLRPSSLIATEGNLCAIGTAFCVKSILATNKTGQNFLKKRTKPAKLFVLVKPRHICGPDAVYNVGYIHRY